MYAVTDSKFEKLANKAMSELPQNYIKGLNNVVIVVEDEPADEQRQKQNLKPQETLLGLYEGIPLTKRGSGYNLVLPDKITLFKKPIESLSYNEAELKENIKRTLWHEIAHFYGLDHNRINELQNKKS